MSADHAHVGLFGISILDHSQPIAFFMSPGGIPPETRAAVLTLSLENVVFLQSRKRF
jgi:hypothetical protein